MAQNRRVNATRGSSTPSRKPKLGQNFLVDLNAARKIVEALGDVANATVVEIGPGKGALTQLLADRAGRLIAIEFDEKLASSLTSRYFGRERVQIVAGDFLKIDLAELLQPEAAVAESRARVVGNIPYYITSDILLRIFEQHDSIDLAVIMMQKEVADRVTAEPGSRDYGLLSVTAQLFAQVETMFTLPPGAFSPPPKVYSTVVRMRIKPCADDLGVDAHKFLQFCRLAFAMKRKTLVNNLRARYGSSEVIKALDTAQIPNETRAEALSIERLATVFRGLGPRDL